MIGPFRLAPYFSPRVWGKTSLAPWYSQKFSEPVGEAWLTGKDCLLESGEVGSTLEAVTAKYPEEILGTNRDGRTDFPLLLKLLFPQERLSVQVHPDDAAAKAVGDPRGKTECWYVLSAEPGASVALGLHPGTTREMVREAVANQTLERQLNWIPVAPGEMIYVDAGTVHAIGPGSVLLETQQYSDLTYRLYDYGRPRELHLDLGLRALKPETEAGKIPPEHHQGYDRLIEKKYFVVERYDLRAREERELENLTGTVHILVALNGRGRLTASGADPVELLPGRAVVVPAAFLKYQLAAGPAFSMVRAMPPGTR